MPLALVVLLRRLLDISRCYAQVNHHHSLAQSIVVVVYKIYLQLHEMVLSRRRKEMIAVYYILTLERVSMTGTS